jgi:hypothetical protein
MDLMPSPNKRCQLNRNDVMYSRNGRMELGNISSRNCAGHRQFVLLHHCDFSDGIVPKADMQKK